MAKTIIISSTSRPNSNTIKVSRIYEKILKSKNVDTEVLDLYSSLPDDFNAKEIHGKRSDAYAKIIEQYIAANKRFVFVVPEYNGSFPGILKLFIDSVHPKDWANKNVCLVGVSVGRAGNLRGMEHLTGIFNYLKLYVYHNKLPISVVDKLLDENGNFNTEEQLKVCAAQIDGFLEWTK